MHRQTATRLRPGASAQASEAVPAHALEVGEALAALGTTSEGLAAASAAERRDRQGPNELPREPAPSLLELVGRQLRGAMVVLLLGAALISLLLGELLDASVILAIVALNTALGAVQEGKAEAAARALESLLSPTALVLRPGSAARRVDAAELVAGDVVLLRAGDQVPADGRLIAARRLEIDEAPMTGESAPVAKRSDPPVPAHVPLADRATMAYLGTTATHGDARLLVTATGPRTELARIARGAARPRRASPLEARVDRFAAVLLRVALGICALLAVLAWIHGTPPGESILVGASLAVAAVPEGLPAVITITLALGMHRLATRGAIVRRLPAVETLGSASVICADKTGTLTTSKMVVERVLCAAGPSGTDGERDVLAAALIASEELADPGEAAIASAAETLGLRRAALVEGWEPVGGEPFDSSRKRMSVVLETSDGARVSYVKGAPEAIATRLADPAKGDELAAIAQGWAAEGTRVIMVARRSGLSDRADPEDQLEAIGLVGIVDPIRETVPESVATARRAGVRTIMITGDHPATAIAVARRCGIGLDRGASNVMTGAELDRLSEDDLGARIDSVDVFARVVPEHKSRIVDALQRRDEVVAMTGDGVNDAPALRAADIGVGIGAGSDAAKAAADIVLAKNDFSTIVAAIEGGRRIYDNILRFVAFLLAANAGEVLVFMLAVVPGLGAPLTIVQILLVNLLTDGVPAVALGVDPADASTMRKPPRPRSQSLLAPLGAQLSVGAVATGTAAFTSFLIGHADTDGAGQTMAFTTLVFAQLGYVYAIRGADAFWRAGRNRFLDAGVALSALIASLVLFVPPLSDAFSIVELEAGQLGAALALAALPFCATETLKWIRRRGMREC
jgi:Ca2+-transporting ATPase